MASSDSQDYVYNCLTRVEREFGINQARVLANALQYKRFLASKGAISFSICPQYLPADGGPYPQRDTNSKVGHISLKKAAPPGTGHSTNQRVKLTGLGC
jgi:hypothetical protein